MNDEVKIVSVNVGQPAPLGQLRGHVVWSGIDKAPVAAELLRLARLNLAGDAQADLQVHGGPDKAVYAYASEHLPAWSAELGLTVGPATFGENLTTAGVLEADVGIGDVWSWGEALLQVVQPRWPCFKLTMRMGIANMALLFRRSGRTGWYFRVLAEGDVPVAGPLRIEARDPARVTITDAHRAALPGADRALVERVLAVDALADEWRGMLEDRRH